MPTTSQPKFNADSDAALMTALSPGASPPPVLMAILKSRLGSAGGPKSCLPEPDGGPCLYAPEPFSRSPFGRELAKGPPDPREEIEGGEQPEREIYATPENPAGPGVKPIVVPVLNPQVDHGVDVDRGTDGHGPPDAGHEQVLRSCTEDRIGRSRCRR